MEIHIFVSVLMFFSFFPLACLLAHATWFSVSCKSPILTKIVYLGLQKYLVFSCLIFLLCIHLSSYVESFIFYSLEIKESYTYGSVFSFLLIVFLTHASCFSFIHTNYVNVD